MNQVTIDPSARVGRGVRLDADPPGRIVVGPGVEIGDGSRLHARGGEIVLGEGSILGERCALVAHAAIRIGRRCRLGDGVAITDFEPVTDDVETPLRLQGLRAAPVEIGDGARLGHGACLLAGASVPAGGTLGVHAVAG